MLLCISLQFEKDQFRKLWKQVLMQVSFSSKHFITMPTKYNVKKVLKTNFELWNIWLMNKNSLKCTLLNCFYQRLKSSWTSVTSVVHVWELAYRYLSVSSSIIRFSRFKILKINILSVKMMFTFRAFLLFISFVSWQQIETFAGKLSIF